VRLAALDLREISEVDLECSGWILGFLGLRVHLNLRVLTLCLNVTQNPELVSPDVRHARYLSHLTFRRWLRTSILVDLCSDTD